MTIKDLAPWKWGKRKGAEVADSFEQPIGMLQRRMNRLFDDFFTGFDLEPFSGWADHFGGFTPKVTVKEDDTRITIEAELPGMEEKDIDISLTKDAITLRGEKREEHEERDGERRHYSERSYGAFQRMIPLQVEIDEDKIDARFIKGVLKIDMPKSPTAQSKAKKISVRSQP